MLFRLTITTMAILFLLSQWREINSRVVRWTLTALLSTALMSIAADTEPGNQVVQYLTGEPPVYWGEVLGRWLRDIFLGKAA